MDEVTLDHLLEAERERLISHDRDLEAREVELAELRAKAQQRIAAIAVLLKKPNDSAEDGGTPDSCGSQFCVCAQAEPRNTRKPAEIAFDILRQRGNEAMHYKDLATAVKNMGGELGGTDAAQTLVAMISKDARFVRPSARGCYSLREFYPTARNVGSRKPAIRTRIAKSHE